MPRKGRVCVPGVTLTKLHLRHLHCRRTLDDILVIDKGGRGKSSGRCHEQSSSDGGELHFRVDDCPRDGRNMSATQALGIEERINLKFQWRWMGYGIQVKVLMVWKRPPKRERHGRASSGGPRRTTNFFSSRVNARRHV